jgi:hypothetical protein
MTKRSTFAMPQRTSLNLCGRDVIFDAFAIEPELRLELGKAAVRMVDGSPHGVPQEYVAGPGNWNRVTDLITNF